MHRDLLHARLAHFRDPFQQLVGRTGQRGLLKYLLGDQSAVRLGLEVMDVARVEVEMRVSIGASGVR